MKNDVQIKLGQRIKKLRKIKGFSQEVFAEKIGIATKTLSSIETGNAFMTSQTLQNIIEILEITPQELFTFQDSMNSDDMYEYVLNKLNFIKNDNERLKVLYNVVKGLV